MKRRPNQNPVIFATRKFDNAGLKYKLYAVWVPGAQLAEVSLYSAAGRALECFNVPMKNKRNREPGQHLRNKLDSLVFQGVMGSELYYNKINEIAGEVAGIVARQKSSFLKR